MHNSQFIHCGIKLNRGWQKVKLRVFCDGSPYLRCIFHNDTTVFHAARKWVTAAWTSVLSVRETSASLDSTQWNMTGSLGRKQMMSSRGHELVLNPWWQEHMVFTSSLLSHTDQWFIFKPNSRMCQWISLSISAKPCVWHTHTWGFSKCLVWFYRESP